MTDNKHEWKAGDRVYLTHSRGWNKYDHPFTAYTIRKIYKTGRFVLEGDKYNQQYDPSHCNHHIFKQPYATATGANMHSGNIYIIPMNLRTNRIAERLVKENILRKMHSVLTKEIPQHIDGTETWAKEVGELLHKAVLLIKGEDMK